MSMSGIYKKQDDFRFTEAFQIKEWERKEGSRTRICRQMSRTYGGRLAAEQEGWKRNTGCAEHLLTRQVGSQLLQG